MTKITAADRMVLVDSQPVLPFGGEFHYFRVDPDHWAPGLGQMRDAAVCTAGLAPTSHLP